jgi:hypothetical protein
MDHEKFLFGNDHDTPTSAEEQNSIEALTKEFEGAVSYYYVSNLREYVFIFIIIKKICNFLQQLFNTFIMQIYQRLMYRPHCNNQLHILIIIH